MPAAPAELTAHFTIAGPDAARAAALEAAGPSGLAREAGPDELILAGPQADVLAVLGDAVTAALDAGAHGLDVRLEAPKESRG
jgi:hypothetical protein